MKIKLLLGFAVQEPKILIFHRARSRSLLGIVDDTHACAIVDVDRGGRLRVAEFVEGEAHDFGLLCVEEKGP